ncbi:MAG: hypothetical protein NTW11_03585 [Candidatus Staskawiczbacteria bacterium]|nr:hypothetical protein [Candidatus Staskawiczbacteria bacterium]
MNKKIIIFLGIISAFFLRVSFASALEVHYPSIFGFSFNNTSSFSEYICYLFGLIQNLAIIVAAFAIIFGGVYYLVSYGQGKFTSEAKEWIKSGISGLLIVVCAFLIMQTINPSLTTCKVGILSVINFNPFGISTINTSATPITYQEIPIGTLTENLLTRTMDCYGFDQKGDPVDGLKIKTDDEEEINAPTYTNYDRADCLTQLVDGAQKKAQVVASLTDELTKLMDTCSCFNKETNTSKCDPVCGSDPAETEETSLNSPPKYFTASFTLSVACTGTGQSTCKPGKRCVGGICVKGTGCTNNANCPPREHCDIASGKCLSGAACLGIGQSSCGAGSHCENGVCVSGTFCSNYFPCAYGKHCVSGICIAGKSSKSGCKKNPLICGKNQRCDQTTDTCADVADGCIEDRSICADDETCNPATDTCVPKVIGCNENPSLCDPDTEKCNPDTDICESKGNGRCDQPPADCPGNWNCSGSCVGAACKQPPNTTDCCPTGVKDQIEHGPIAVPFNGAGASCVGNDTACNPSSVCSTGQICTTSPSGADTCDGTEEGTSCTKGIDLNCPLGLTCDDATRKCVGNAGSGITCNPESACSDGQKCSMNSYGSPTCDGLVGGTACIIGVDTSCPIGLTCNEKTKTCANSYAGLDEFRCDETLADSNPNAVFTSCAGADVKEFVEEQYTVNKKTVTIINKENWDKLNMAQQLIYLQTKILEITQKIQNDKSILSQAETTLNTCYLATPYVELLNIYKQADQKNIVILTQKPFADPETGKAINPSKYCNGFNYDNSSCLKKCNDACPDASNAVLQAYTACTDPSNQDECIKNAYNARLCVNGPDTSKTFGECINSCQDSCSNDCEARYLKCSKEYNFCQSQCNNNSKCVLDNTDTCLIDSSKFAYCADQNIDPNNAAFCINNSYLCKNGSDEYAGYPDCIDTSVAGCSIDKYSSSFIYDSHNSAGPYCEKCPEPYQPAKSGVCYSSKSPNSACQKVCPETTKCPASSDCPSCPCDKIDQTIDFTVPNENTWTNAGNEGYGAEQKDVSAFQMAGPQCNTYSYNDDPLTFYCENNWILPTSISKQNYDKINEPLGKIYKIDMGKEGEIPVGQTVDNAENWADQTINSAYNMYSYMQGMLNMMQKAGQAIDNTIVQNYCMCGAEYENASPICTTNCSYNKLPVFVDGSLIGYTCNCLVAPCKGSPCDQMKSYMSQIWNYNRQLKLKFIDFYMYMLAEPRSDIIKELAYSRQTTNNCSSKSEGGTDLKLLSCTRTKHELISPIIDGQINFNGKLIEGYCYGKDLGNLFDKSLLDNWFCLQKYAK